MSMGMCERQTEAGFILWDQQCLKMKPASSRALLFLLRECVFGPKPTYRQMTLYILGIQVPSNSYLVRQILINMPARVRNHPNFSESFKQQ